MQKASSMKVENLDHLGLVAGLITADIKNWRNQRSSLEPSQRFQGDKAMEINGNGNCAKPAAAIDPDRGHQSQEVEQENSKLWDC